MTLVLTRCALDLERGVVVPTDGAAPVRLTTRELALLSYLASRAGPVRRDELLTQVWGYSALAETRVCDTTVARVRAKIEVDPAAPDHLRTVHGEGYQLVAPGTEPVRPPSPQPSNPRREHVVEGVRIDVDGLTVVGPAGAQALTANEAALLRRLIRAAGDAVDRRDLARAVWGDHRDGGRLKSAIHRLRAKIEADPRSPRILTTDGDGYRLAHATGDRLVLPSDRRFGPADAVDEVLARVETDRLVTLTGIGGIGKSRLALTVGHALQAAGREVSWVEAAAAHDLATLATLIARKLGVAVPTGADPMVAVAQVVRPRGAMVLILDNLEQLPEAGDGVRALLEQAPRLVVIATSRVRIRVPGERIVRVAPLGLPDAVALFTDRAARLPTPDETAEVEALVAGLDGIPLALELAAAATRSLRVGEIRAHHLADPRAPERHRSLGASLDLSWRLASPWARDALAQLSVFRGWIAVDRAEGVLALGPDAPPVIDALEALADASLVQVAPRGDRLLMPVVVAEYASSKLSDAARLDAEVRHGREMARLGHPDVLVRVFGPDDTEVRRTLVDELENLAVATERAIGRGDAAVASATACAAWRGFQITGPARAAALLLERAAAVPGAEARVGTAAGEAWVVAGDNARAEPLLTGAERGDPRAVLQRLRVTRNRDPMNPGDADEAVLAHAVRTGNLPLEWSALMSIGIGQYCADRDWRPSMAAAADRAARLGGPRIIASTELCLAEMERSDGRFAEARRHAERGGALAEGLGDRAMASRALAELGRIELLTGDVGRARDAFEEAARVQRALGDHQALGRSLAILGKVLVQMFELDAAERVLAEAVDIATEAQAADTVRVAQQYRVEAAVADGRYDDAERLLAVLGDLARRCGRRAEGMTQLGWARLHAARGERALAYAAQEAVREVVASGDPATGGMALADFAVVAAAFGDADRARADVAAALACSPVAGVAGRCALALGRIALADGDVAGARSQAVSAVATLRGTGERAQLSRALVLAAEVDAALGDVDGARRALDEAAAWVERGLDEARFAAVRARIGV